MALSASIDDLKATIGNRGGIARSNRYVIYFNHPARGGVISQFIPTTGAEIVGAIGNIAQTTLNGGNLSLSAFISDPRDLSLLCESAAIPGRSITTQEHYTDMKPIKRPYSFLMEDAEFQFLLTQDYYVYKYFHSWMDLIIRDTGDGHRQIGYKREFTTNVTIQQVHGVDMVPIQSVTLHNAFPLTVSQVQLSNNNANEPSRISVQMAYDYYETSGFIEGAVAGGAAGVASRLRGLLS